MGREIASSMKVLIVEDDPAVSYFLEQVVLTSGHEPEVVADAESAHHAYQKFQPHLILSDYLLPMGSGMELLEKIRKTDSDVIFIIMTGHGSEETATQALELRANNYLTKPIRYEVLSTLLAKYDELVHTRSMRQEIRRMVIRRETEIVIDNRVEIVSEVSDFLTGEAAPFLTEEERFGVQLGLYELISNAIEHGNLGITYEEKNQALFEGSNRYIDLMNRRRADPERERRRVRIRYHLDDGKLEWLISDEGEGFDWYRLPNPLAGSNYEKLCGRGIFLARFQFDELSFLGTGNRVRVTKKRSRASAENPLPRQSSIPHQ